MKLFDLLDALIVAIAETAIRLTFAVVTGLVYVQFAGFALLSLALLSFVFYFVGRLLMLGFVG